MALLHRTASIRGPGIFRSHCEHRLSIRCRCLGHSRTGWFSSTSASKILDDRFHQPGSSDRGWFAGISALLWFVGISGVLYCCVDISEAVCGEYGESSALCSYVGASTALASRTGPLPYADGFPVPFLFHWSQFAACALLRFRQISHALTTIAIATTGTTTPTAMAVVLAVLAAASAAAACVDVAEAPVAPGVAVGSPEPAVHIHAC